MKEIESMLEDTRLKTKLARNEPIDADEFLNESLHEEFEQNNMRSLYLTEPIPASGNIARHIRQKLKHQSDKELIMSTDFDINKLYNQEKNQRSQFPNVRAKSNNPITNVYVDIKSKSKLNKTAEIQKPESQACDSSTIEKANQMLIERVKSRKTYTGYRQVRDKKIKENVSNQKLTNKMHTSNRTRKEYFMIINSVKKNNDFTLPSTSVLADRHHKCKINSPCFLF